MEKRLYRDEHRKKIAGVCAGLADYFNMDVSIVRALFLLALILKGGGVVIYIVLWIVLPVKHYFMILFQSRILSAVSTGIVSVGCFIFRNL